MIQSSYIFIRHVAHQANHDIGHRGLNFEIIRKMISKYENYNFIISSEKMLPTDLEKYNFKGLKNDLHAVIAHATLYIGDSPTMAIEAALLGVPGCFVSTHSCGNINNIMSRYGIIKQCHANWLTIENIINALLNITYAERLKIMSEIHQDHIDVTAMIIHCLTHYSDFKDQIPSCYTNM